MWASAPTGVRGGADVHKRRPHAFGPPSVPVGAAFMAARFCPIPRVSVREPRGSGRMWASAPTDVRPAGAGDHKGRPYVLGPPGAPVGAAFVAAPTASPARPEAPRPAWTARHFIPLAFDAVAQGRDDAEVDVHGLEVGDALVADIARQGADGGLLGKSTGASPPAAGPAPRRPGSRRRWTPRTPPRR